jgi:hypothetical protein
MNQFRDWLGQNRVRLIRAPKGATYTSLRRRPIVLLLSFRSALLLSFRSALLLSFRSAAEESAVRQKWQDKKQQDGTGQNENQRAKGPTHSFCQTAHYLSHPTLDTAATIKSGRNQSPALSRAFDFSTITTTEVQT